MTDEDTEQHPPRGGHPLQPVALDEHGVVRFKANKIVRHLLVGWTSRPKIGSNSRSSSATR